MDFSKAMYDAGVIYLRKMVSIPQGKNKIQIRLESIEDFLSGSDASRSFHSTIDLEKVADAFWKQYNGNATYNVDIKEMTPTGNMEVSEMLERKI